jgi:hypothetical protein
LIKQPTIVLGCASILMMMVCSLSHRKIREIFNNGLGFLLGLVGIVGLVALYWLSTGTLNQFIDGALLQGFSFMGGQGSTIREYFFYSLVNVLPNLMIGKLYLIALFSAMVFLLEKLYRFWLRPIFTAHLSWVEWFLLAVLVIAPWIAKGMWPAQYIGKWVLISIVLLGVFFLAKFYRLQTKPITQQVFSPIEWTWLIGVVSLPVEVLMASLGGRYFGHYFISMLPAVTLVIAYPIWRAVSALRQSLKSGRELLRNLVYMVLALGTLVWGVSSSVQVWPSALYRADLSEIFRDHVFLNDLEKYIIQTTQPEDEVLVWHIHLGINFNTDRRAPAVSIPSQLVYSPTAQNTKLNEFLDDIENQPPQLILVQNVSSLALPFVDQPVDQLCQTYCTPEFEQALQIPQIHQQWLRFQQYFVDNYVLDHKIYDWTIYRKLP